MLIRSTWTFTVDTPTVLPRAYGLALMKDLHDRLGLEIGQDNIPSTTFSGLLGQVQPAQDFVTLLPDRPYLLTICGLQKTASVAIAELNLPDELPFLGASFHVALQNQEIIHYEDLYQRLVASDPTPERRFTLTFLTPTAFSQGKTYLPLPLPTLMFRSWLERWNHFAPVYLGGDDLIAYLGDAIALTRHRIQTQSFQIHKGRVTGFTGDVTLQVLSRADPLLANVANLLVRYAQFSGTGIKTRLGMGQTKIDLPT
jgi:CRISPR-associated endoribonuclease Cas6